MDISAVGRPGPAHHQERLADTEPAGTGGADMPALVVGGTVVGRGGRLLILLLWCLLGLWLIGSHGQTAK